VSVIGTGVASAFLVSLMLVRDQRQAAILVAAFTIRAAVSVVGAAGVALPDSHCDARTFERVAWFWARDGRLFDDFTTGSYLYSWLTSGIYIFVGRDPFLLHIINSYFGTLAIYYVMRSARQLVPDGTVDRAAGWTLAFYPSAVLYSVLTMREAPMVLALSISIYLLLRWLNTRLIAFGLGAIVSVVVAQLFHAGMIGATVVIMLTYARVSLQSVTVRNNLRPIALLIVAAVAISVLQFSLRTSIGLEKISGFLYDFSLDTIASWQAYSARGRGAYLSAVELTTWLDFVWNVPLRVFFFLGSPFIWMASRFRDMLGMLDGMVILFFGMKITVDIMQRRFRTMTGYLPVALVAAGLVVLFALGTSNYGTAFRHRAKIFPWLLLLYLCGRACPRRLSRKRQRRLNRKVASTAEPAQPA